MGKSCFLSLYTDVVEFMLHAEHCVGAPLVHTVDQLDIGSTSLQK